MNPLLIGLIAGLEPAPDFTCTQWADNYRMIPAKGGIEPGRYNSNRTPYVKEIMDALSVTNPCTDITFVKGTQLGATEIGNNFFGYVVDVEPGPMLMVFPTDKLGADHSRSKLTPTIDETESLKNKVAEAKSRSSTNNITTKDFPGGILFISGANSPANFRNKSIRFLVLDDYDGFPITVGKEGDPGSLAEKRTDTYSVRKKIYRNSTPTIKGLSPIWAKFLEADQRQYYVPCPHCGHMQVLVWGGKKVRRGIKFVVNAAGVPVEAWYVCEKCHEGIDESFKSEMLAAGQWRAKFPEREKRGYHLSSLYSPLGWVSWLQIVKEFWEAKDNPEKLKVWTNTRMAEVWDEKGSQPEWAELKNRAGGYRLRTAPENVSLITAGVDVQQDRLAVLVRGWGDYEQSWLIHYGELFGDPGQPGGVWNDLDNFISQPFFDSDGRFPIYIAQVAVDSGYHTQSVYNYCRLRPIKCMATKGMSTMNKPIIGAASKVDVDFMGTKIKNGCELWPVGTDTAKSQIYHRLSMKKVGPGYYHFPIGADDEYYLQLTAEKKVTQYKNGFPAPVWVKLRERNEALDCEVLALVAAYREGMAFANWELMSQARKSPPAPVQRPAKRNKKKPGRRSNW